jgi:hypothetical protein
MQPTIIEPVRPFLRSLADPSEQWLWCAECRRFQQVRHLRGGLGDARCAFADCIGVGLDLDLYRWDATREPADPRWPQAVAQLRLGLRSPDMDAFHRARAARERRAIVSDFLGSGASERDEAPWLVALLELASQVNVEPDAVDADTLDYALFTAFPSMPRCRTAPASEIVAELRAFFCHARTLGRFPHAEACLGYLGHRDLGAELDARFELARRQRPVRRDDPRRKRRGALRHLRRRLSRRG